MVTSVEKVVFGVVMVLVGIDQCWCWTPHGLCGADRTGDQFTPGRDLGTRYCVTNVSGGLPERVRTTAKIRVCKSVFLV